MGLTPTPPDAHQRRIAARIERDYPAWLIIWGLHTRLYWAFAQFGTRSGIIAAPGSRELTDRIRRAELAARAHASHQHPNCPGHTPGQP